MHRFSFQAFRNALAVSLLALTVMMVSAQESVEITIAHTMTGGTHRAAFDDIVDAFHEAHPNIRVRQMPQDMEIYQDTGLIAMLRSNNPPDIYFQWGGDLVARDARLGFAADLTEVLERDGWGEQFIDAAWSEASGTMYEGGIYMVPYALDVTTVLWYNTAVFEQYGLEEPETWDDFMAIITTLVENGETPIILGNRDLWPLGNWAGHITARVVGMDLFDKALRLEEPFAQPAFEHAFGLFEELANAGAFNRDLSGLGAAESMNAFFQSAGVMHPIGSWLIPNAHDSAPDDFEYDAFNTPIIPGGEGDPQSIIGLATGFIVSPSSEHFEEVITFLQYFYNHDNQVAWAEAGRFSPIRGAMEAANIDPHNKKLADLFQDAGEIVPPPDTGYPVEIADTFYQAAAYVAAGMRTPSEALEWLDQQLEATQ